MNVSATVTSILHLHQYKYLKTTSGKDTFGGALITTQAGNYCPFPTKERREKRTEQPLIYYKLLSNFVSIPYFT
jgi:hypothetical protein